MKLATLRDGTRDGALVVVRHDGAAFARAHDVARTLQAALDAWESTEPGLRALSERLDAGRIDGEPLDVRQLHAPLPRAYEWVDGSAFLNHVRLVRKARGAEPPPTLETDPLVYQGGSGVLLGPTEISTLPDPAWGLDFESEIVRDAGRRADGDDGRRGRPVRAAGHAVQRRQPAQPHPRRAGEGLRLLPEQAGDRLLPVRRHARRARAGVARRPGARLGPRRRSTARWSETTDAGPEMHFSFFELIEHVAKTRAFTAGTILGSGTVSNEDRARGICCLAERRMIETIEQGKPKTPFIERGRPDRDRDARRRGEKPLRTHRADGGGARMKLYGYWRSGCTWRVRIAPRAEGRRLRVRCRCTS